MKLTISACCIVKNESRNLPRWLKCMQQVADSLIGCRRYREAMLLLADMAGSVTESGRYSLLAGIACYGMGEYQAAMGCLQQAECRALTGAEQARLISYMAWCREAVAK